MTSRVFAVALLLALVIAIVGCTAPGPTGDKLHSPAPDVVGLSQSDASREILDAGYEVGAVIVRSEPSGEPGKVFSQDPIAGTSLARGREISLVIAK